MNANPITIQLENAFAIDPFDTAMKLVGEPGGRDKLRILHKVEEPGGLDLCEDPECMLCGLVACPQGEPLHFHHDGCPACSFERPGAPLGYDDATEQERAEIIESTITQPIRRAVKP